MQALHVRTFVGNIGTSGVTCNYLTVGSRPFAAVQAPGNQSSGPEALVPPQLETDLRQTKWQKVRNPPTTSLVVPIASILYLDPDQRSGYGWDSQSHVATHVGGQAMDALHLGSGRDARCGRRRHSLLRPVCGRRRARGTSHLTPRHVECTLRMVVQFRGQR